jgi:flagellar motility protein MotE (MotC chaperone)
MGEIEMLRAFRNTTAIAATAMLICTGTATADSTWTVTVKNTSKVTADLTLLSGGLQVGMKATVKPDGGTSQIAIPAKKGSYSWKAEYGGKSCGSHSVDISGPTTISVTCDAAPSASSQPKPPADSSSQPKQTSSGASSTTVSNLRRLQEKLDLAEHDIAGFNEELKKVTSEPSRGKLEYRLAERRRFLEQLEHEFRDIATNPSDLANWAKQFKHVEDQIADLQNRLAKLHNW